MWKPESKEREGKPQPASPVLPHLFIQAPADWVVMPMSRVGLPSPRSLSHRHTQECSVLSSQVSLNPIQLTFRINYHRRPS